MEGLLFKTTKSWANEFSHYCVNKKVHVRKRQNRVHTDNVEWEIIGPCNCDDEQVYKSAEKIPDELGIKPQTDSTERANFCIGYFLPHSEKILFHKRHGNVLYGSLDDAVANLDYVNSVTTEENRIFQLVQVETPC